LIENNTPSPVGGAGDGVTRNMTCLFAQSHHVLISWSQASSVLRRLIVIHSYIYLPAVPIIHLYCRSVIEHLVVRD